MKWIKTSERLPIEEGYYFCRWADTLYKFVSKFNTTHKFYAADASGMEWLDESTPVPDKVEDAAKGYAYKNQDKLPSEHWYLLRDAFEDGSLWQSTESGQSTQSDAVEFAEWMKEGSWWQGNLTTNQLYQLFKQSK